VTTTPDLLQRLARLDSTVLSDALDAFGLPPGLGELRAQWGRPRICGVARTVALEPDPGGDPGPHIATAAIASAGAGDVIVVANQGRTDVSCWGGLLSLGSTARGIAGVVADGACRDVAEAEQHGFPVFARGTTPRTARGRLRQQAVGGTVTVAGVEVAEGDLVVADDSGVVFVPRGRAEEVLERAEAIVGREAAIAADIAAGKAMTEAMHDARLAGTSRGAPGDREVREPGAAELLTGLPTAAISDALDRLGLPGSLHGIGPLHPGSRACGPAFTVAYVPVDDRGGTVGDFLDDVPPGAVVLIDNAGRTDCTVWGGIMTSVAAAAGVAATVVHGVCRDTATAARTGYPLWSAGRFMRTGKDRVRLAAVQQPVTVDGVTVHPGDLVCGDEDGVVVVPAHRAGEVARLAADVEAAEERVLAAVAAGARLADARAAQGYHALQSAHPGPGHHDERDDAPYDVTASAAHRPRGGSDVAGSEERALAALQNRYRHPDGEALEVLRARVRLVGRLVVVDLEQVEHPRLPAVLVGDVVLVAWLLAGQWGELPEGVQDDVLGSLPGGPGGTHDVGHGIPLETRLGPGHLDGGGPSRRCSGVSGSCRTAGRRRGRRRGAAAAPPAGRPASCR
jgi:regulator of RNase E activity RraA